MKVVDNREARLIGAEDLQLMPGKNLLDTPDKVALWEQAKKNDVVKHMLRAKMLVEEGVDEEDTGEVVSLINETLDYAVLEAMKETETRSEVLKAIDAQLAKLGPTDEQKQKLDEQKKRDDKSRKEAAKAAAGAKSKTTQVNADEGAKTE